MEAALAELADVDEDDPDMVDLRAKLGFSYLTAREYELADRMLASALAQAERLGLTKVAAEALLHKGTSAFYQGRLWEARALAAGGLQVAVEGGLEDTQLRIMSMLPSFTALDDPRASVAVQREAIELARHVGSRARELGILFNVVEDARRTGDWDWARAELAAAQQLDIDDASLVGLRVQELFFRIYSGDASAAEIDEIERAVKEMDDSDLVAGVLDGRGVLAHRDGRWVDAGRAWASIAEVSDLNAPYALPRAARAFVVGRDGAAAEAALDRLAALGARGRAIEGDRATIRAGLAALGGDRESAVAGYRTAIAAFRDLGLVWDEANLGLEATVLLSAADPEIGSWADTSRETFVRIGAGSLAALLDTTRASEGGTAAPLASADAASRRGRAKLARRLSRSACSPGITSRPRVSITCGSQTSRTLKITCWAPASESSPNQSTICAGVSPGRSSVLSFTVWSVERSISSGSRPIASQCSRRTSYLWWIRTRAAEHVARVGVLGHQAERLPLAAAADHDRRMGPA